MNGQLLTETITLLENGLNHSFKFHKIEWFSSFDYFVEMVIKQLISYDSNDSNDSKNGIKNLD